MEHNPVMLREVLEYLSPKDGGVYVDATFGAGGYTKAILNAANCTVISIDQDPSAKKFADEIKNKNFKFVEGNFGDLEELITEKVDGIVFDIGVSSMQFDNAERGFSFSRVGPLDMRMSSCGTSAADFLNSAAEKEIADVIYTYGEERASRRIAKSIVNSRPLTTTLDLAEAVYKVCGRHGKINPATKTFQAIRIFINRELEVLERGLEAAFNLLKTGGRMVVVTFHSLEDRIVKRFFKEKSGQNISVNRHSPEAKFLSPEITDKKNAKNVKKVLEIITKKAIMPEGDELVNNLRARSAKLRTAEIKEICHA